MAKLAVIENESPCYYQANSINIQTPKQMNDEHQSKRFHLGEQLTNFISGLIAGVISVSVCNPLDMTRTRLNVLNSPTHHSSSPKYAHFSHAMHTIWREQGWRGFYSGYRTNVIAIPLFYSLFFPIYEYTKKVATAYGYNKGQSYLAASVVSGGVCNLVTNPIWIVRTRLMAQYLHHEDNQYKTASPFAVMKEMYRKEGVASFFKGLTASLFTVSNAIIYFELYEKIKEMFRKTHQLTIVNIFYASTLSKIIATVATYPITVVRTVLYDFRGRQVQKMLGIVKFILKQNGIKGFYAGIIPDLIRLIPSNAITFVVYQKMKQFL